MTDVLVKHAFVSPKADGPDTTKIRASNWNAAELFSGGGLGDLAFRDTGAATGASWLPSVAIGSFLRSAGVGAAPVWSTLTLPNAASQGDLLMATGANVLGSLADIAVGSVLMSGGVGAVPAWNASPSLTAMTVSAAGFLAFSGRSLFRAPATGQFSLLNSGETAGVGFDVTTDSTLKVRTRAQSAYGTVDALSYSVSGAGPILTTSSDITRVSAKAIVVADAAVLALAIASSGMGLLIVTNATQGLPAVLLLNGGAAPTLVAGSAALFTITAGTSSRTNIYWSAANSRYELENKMGSSQSYNITYIGRTIGF